MHEFGHWVTAQRVGLQIYGLGLYGLTRNNDGTIIVTQGGGVAIGTGRARYWSFVVANVGGIVAEKLAQNEAFAFDDPLTLLSAPDCLHDLHDARLHLGLMGVRVAERAELDEMLTKAISEAAEIVRPLLANLDNRVAQLEDVVRSRQLSKVEIAWSGVHAAMLSGGDPSDYE